MTRHYYPAQVPTEVLWGAVAPVEHSVQIYANDEVFLDALDGFVSGGLRAGDSVIVIATGAHRLALEERLRRRGFNVDLARAEDRYIPLDAEATLSRFMIKGWPDEERMLQVVGGLLGRARGQGRRVRAFGEMVALLWQQGQTGATVQLEALWNQFCAEAGFCLFCAYPQSGFPQDAQSALAEICAHHSRIIGEPVPPAAASAAKH